MEHDVNTLFSLFLLLPTFYTPFRAKNVVVLFPSHPVGLLSRFTLVHRGLLHEMKIKYPPSSLERIKNLSIRVICALFHALATVHHLYSNISYAAKTLPILRPRLTLGSQGRIVPKDRKRKFVAARRQRVLRSEGGTWPAFFLRAVWATIA